MRLYEARLAAVGATVLVLFGCGTEHSPSDVATDLEYTLQRIVDSVVAADVAIPGVSLTVISPTLGIEWEGASGFADPENGTPMTPAHPVRIASNTKTYVAAAILRLVENGRLDLGAAVADHLPDELVALLESDGYEPREITIRHLLTHAGGLYDHGAADAYTEAIIDDPRHRWTRAEQVGFMVEWGDPYGPPGTIFSYSDTGYVLLGSILERTTKQDLATAVRELVGFGGLGLDATWWEILESRPDGVAERAHQFYGELDVTSFLPYYDLYGGGGLVATTGDLARFFGALFRDRVFDDHSTVETMLSTFEGLRPAPDATERSLPPGAYRMGVWVLETEGLTTYRHTGFWGTLAVHVPALDLTIAATVNQNRAKPVFEHILRDVIAVVREVDRDG